MACLREAAAKAGPVVWRAHSTSGGGWGITGKRDRRTFCSFDPKPSVPHVCASVPGADEHELKTVGTVHLRKNANPWVDVKDLRGAGCLEPLILRAYAAAAPTPTPVKQAVTQPNLRPTSRPAVAITLESPVPALLPVGARTGEGDRRVSVREDLRLQGFVHAGAIRSLDSGRICRAELKPLGFRGCVVYGLVVLDQFKKCGDTGRKNATLTSRMEGCASTINQILRGVLRGPFTERFKSLAPKAIEAGHDIEVWAREATAGECERLQRELNAKYDTIRTGWANRLK